MTSGLRNQFSVRLNQTAYKIIHASGQRPADWLRQAVDWRIEHERQAVSALTTLEQRMDALERQVMGNQQGILKLLQADAIAQAGLAEMRQLLVTLQHNQAELQRTVIAMEKGIGDTLVALGPTLLAALSQQFERSVNTDGDHGPPKRRWPAAPPRTKL